MRTAKKIVKRLHRAANKAMEGRYGKAVSVHRYQLLCQAWKQVYGNRLWFVFYDLHMQIIRSRIP